MEVIKSANDKREYRVIQLENGLKALLVSNPPDADGYQSSTEVESESEEGSEGDESDDEEDMEENEDGEKEEKKKNAERQSAAALCVGVGSFCDPDDIPGFAHFLEHMVFMGSDKFPKENELDDYLGKHGGFSNAWTDCEKTVFYFEIQKKNFYKALDMFAHFFISPLLRQDCVDREVKAVDSEFQMSVPNDGDRVNQLISSLAREGHPMRKFMCGNLKTLKTLPEEKGVNIYDHLREFYNNMYSAHYMTLAIESKESLDTLEKYVREIFSKIPNNQKTQPSFKLMKEPFNTQEFRKFYRVSSVENAHSLEILWSFPSLLHEYRVKPLDYLSTLITHEGKGSILSYLKKRTLALSLSGGNNFTGTENNSTCSTFYINITLTDEGLQQVYQILTVIFEYLHLLRTVGPQKHIFDEQKIIEDNKFRWREKGEAVDYVEELSENMQIFPVEHYLTGRHLIYDYDEKLIKECADILKPDTANIVLRSKSFDSQGILNKEEKWYSTKYNVQDIDPEWVEKWRNVLPNAELYLPEPNKFISTNFEILDSNVTEHPKIILEENGSQFWFKKDNKFNVPKGSVYIRITSPVVIENLLNSIMNDLFINLLLQNITESVYPGVLAGYEYSIDSFATGIILTVTGFNHKLALFLDTILEHIRDFKIDSDMFKAVQIQLKKTYYNDMIRPKELAKVLDTAILDPHYYPLPDKYKHIMSITDTMLQTFILQLRNSLFIDCFTHGNFIKQDVKDMAVMIMSKLRLSKPSIDLKPKRCYHKVPESQTYCRVNGVNREDSNSCVMNYYQSIPGTIYNSVLNEVLVTRMKEPCFDILRTKHQLGYSVGANTRTNNGILGLQVYVQSQATKFSLTTIDDHITSFLQEFQHTLTNMTNEEFYSLVKSVITSKQLAEVSLEEETGRLWREISRENYVFDRREKEIALLEKLTQKEVINWYQQYINNTQRKLSIQVEGNKDDTDKKMCTDDDIDNIDGMVISCDNLVFKGQGEPDRTFITDIDQFKKTLVVLPYAFINS
ncbi:hypothetical protein SNE40_011665 [Patella caerulea]|uniref:Nardilysin n=1 Tax=Patella caerulea TaxID=87958 RepID=A0AAN8PJ53_PATCE